MKRFLLIFSTIILISFLFQTCKKDDLKNLNCNTVPSSYNADVKPIITAHCATSTGCHSAGSSRDYSTYSGLKIVADNGSLEKTTLTDKTMPPSGALSLDDRKKIKCWLNNGSQNN
jgi:hypothetical protein